MSSEYCICPPKLTSLEGDGPTKVTVKSSHHQKKAVEVISKHFRREMNYSTVQFSAKEKENDLDFTPYEAYLFHKERYNLIHQYKPNEVVCLGGCCFYKNNETWDLHWVWIHPYFRNRGILSELWPKFIQKYGNFGIEEPISLQMQKIINKFTT